MSRTGSVRFKRLAALLLPVLLGAALSGCLEHPLHHSRREVIAYLDGEFPGEDITVSRKYTETPDNYHINRTIRSWDCWFTDLPDAVFQVSSAWWSTNPVPQAGYGLDNNARRLLWDYYLEQYLQEVGSLDAWEVKGDRFVLVFTSAAQVYPAQEQLQAFYDWLAEQPHAQNPQSVLCYLVGLSLPEFHLDTQKYFGAYDCGTMTDTCARMIKTYYAFYGLPCPNFSVKELEDYALARWIWDFNLSCCRNGELVPSSTLAGISLNSLHISYAGLYEMLFRLDFELEGTPEDFSFTGADGALYEFSYEGVLHQEGKTDWWYYLRDGETVESDAPDAPVLYLLGEALQTMIGLDYIRIE